MNKVKEELETLKSWGFETVPIDKVLEMIEKTEDTKSKSTEKSVINISYPPCIKGEGVDKYFREIPVSTNTERTFSGSDVIPSARKFWYT